MSTASNMSMTHTGTVSLWVMTARCTVSARQALPRTRKHSYRKVRSTVLEVGALSNLDEISVRVADIAARLAVLGDRLRDELRTATFPQFIARLNISNAEVHEAVDVIRVGDAES